ncbi:MAG: FkbM family methyltransferase, partial [Acidithiobacillus ferrooxidans]|jgi:FkbM family methyltransferase|nr:FkbM family methyltransferase [Acidithiobacillus ferrooxidans]
LLSFVRWQIGLRLIRSSLLVDWVNEARFIVKRGERGLTGNLYCGFMDFEDMCFLLHYLRDTDNFFDIGANVGAYTILASGVVRANSFAFEPLPDTFDRLVDQININRISDLVVLENKGVGEKAGVLEFTNQFNCMNRVNKDPNNKNVTSVDVVSLDQFHTPIKPTAVKIDVEGYEYYVLEGGHEFFSNNLVKMVIIEMNGSGAQFGIQDDVLDKKLRSYGFFPVSYDPVNRSVEFISCYNKGGNTIYLKDIYDASLRCSKADVVLVHTARGTRI